MHNILRKHSRPSLHLRQGRNKHHSRSHNLRLLPLLCLHCSLVLPLRLHHSLLLLLHLHHSLLLLLRLCHRLLPILCLCHRLSLQLLHRPLSLHLFLCNLLLHLFPYHPLLQSSHLLEVLTPILHLLRHVGPIAASKC